MADVILRQVSLPEYPADDEPPLIPDTEYLRRCDETVRRAGTPWVAIYGDREHNANLLFLCGFDPRFEEALLLLGPNGQRCLLVGNEGVIHAVEARPAPQVLMYQGFSLMAQPRDQTPVLEAVLSDAGLGSGDVVGVVGWKYLTVAEHADTRRPSWVPVHVVDALRRVTGEAPVDVTSVLMSATDGLRAQNGAEQIAVFAWAALRASQSVFNVVRGVQPGMSERQAASLFGWAGEPLSMHPIVASGGPGETINGLRSATGRRIALGDGISTGIGYWGSLCCRAGMVEEAVSHEFFHNYVRPYFLALAAWYETIGLGVTGGSIFAAVDDTLAGANATFRPSLNPGHLTSYDEWVHSPIERGSTIRLASGMAIQCDIIPAPMPPGAMLNCEDSVVLADEPLRQEIAHQFPALWSRIEATRALMHDALGITLKPEVLPLSLANAYLPPAWLAPDMVCALA
ncbi:MAG: M24 family metallopeptidase [Thermomicrobiales bacterium]|nr:M24 family metallopeptidase [Thermomicrobiales bacterium]